jgi:hypothetical protein
MRFWRQYRFILLFLALLVFCSVMVLRQFRVRQTKHVEIRDAFILLHTRGYTNEARRLYQRLLVGIPQLKNHELINDFQRTLMLIDPYTEHTNNLIWNYHWTISNELDRRSESTLERAKKLAQEE